MEFFSEYVLQERLAERRNITIYRGRKHDNSRSCIVKILKPKTFTPSEIARLKQEYNLVKTLDIESVVKTYDLVEYHNQYAIVEEEVEGTSLKEMLKQQKWY